MATPAAPTPSAEGVWKVVTIQREALTKELQKIQNGGPSSNETARFEKVEKLMENFRLNCVGLIFLDTRGADEMTAEDALWQAHTNITRVYRRVIGQLPADRVVLKRKVEKLYLTFLKISHGFYKGFLQRICSFHDIKELKRIARIAELEDLKPLDSDKASPKDEKRQKIAIGMCHKILVHLGDLARYRTLARTKDRRWNTALTYYALANELIPESGFGYHQCGVIYTETEDHLEVVYHFYRALASEKPHPMALTNLEREFQKLREGRASGRGGSNDAMISWFVKLHAYYFKGEQFSGRKELEDEVDTRLAMALKKGGQSDINMGLLKMVLINILAYQVGLDKIRTKWTDSGSLSCQFILLQNVRTIQNITRLLREELVEAVHRQPVEVPADSTGQKEDKGKYTSTFHSVLPLLRVYMTWLCFSSADLVGYKEHLEPQFGQMCKTLASTLNLLFDLVASNIASVQNRVSWRFPEDEETLGMKCLNGPKLPEGTQLCYDPIHRTPKPRAEEVKDAKFTADDITATRALDVISCALDLANQSPFPIVHSKILDGAQEQAKFIYTENGKPQVLSQKLTSQPEPSGRVVPTPTAPATVPATVPPAAQEPLKAAPAAENMANDSDEFSEDQEFYRGPAGKPTYAKTSDPLEAKDTSSKPQTTQTNNPSEFPLDSQLFRILNDFLVPPETGRAAKSSETQGQASVQMGGSYGMPATNNEVFGSVAPASPNPGSATAKAFPTLPWNYFLNPAPVDGGVRSASGPSSGWEQTYGQPRSRPGTSSNATPTLSPGGTTSALAYRQLQNRNSAQLSPMPSGHRVSTSEQMHLGAPPGIDFNEHINQTLRGSGVRDVWANSTGSNTAPANPWSSPAGRWDLGQHSAANQAAPQSSFSSLAFSGVNSSLPPVNSPWGVPMKTTQTDFPNGAGQSAAWTDSTQSPPGFGGTSSRTPTTGNTQAPPPGFGYGNGNGRAYDSMASYGSGNSYTVGQAMGAGWGTPKLELHEGNNAAMNPWANGHQSKVTPPPGFAPPGFAPSTTRRGGSTDLSKTAVGQNPKQQPPIAAIREPLGPGANGRTGFNVPKR